MTGRFLIAVPRLNSRSNGVCLLYELALGLHAAGQQVVLVCNDLRGTTTRDDKKLARRYSVVPHVVWETDFGADSVENTDVAVYSETVAGNPFGANQVVRYMMNIPGVFSRETLGIADTDFVVSYSRFVDPELDQVFLLKPESLRPPGRKKDQVAVHFGKTNRSALAAKFGSVENYLLGFRRRKVITRGYPKSRRRLLRIIRESRVLVSFDPLSNLHYEATLVGTPVLIADDSIYQKRTDFNIALNGYYYDKDDVGQFRYGDVVAVLEEQLAEGNSRSIRHLIEACRDHFKRVTTDPEYRAAWVERLRARQKAWEAATNRIIDDHLINIETPIQIPLNMARAIDPILGLQVWWSTLGLPGLKRWLLGQRWIAWLASRLRRGNT